MRGIVVILLLLTGYTLVYVGVSKFTNGLTFAEAGATGTTTSGP